MIALSLCDTTSATGALSTRRRRTASMYALRCWCIAGACVAASVCRAGAFGVIVEAGRPVGVVIDGRGAVLVADDVGNTVWRVSAVRSPSSSR